MYAIRRFALLAVGTLTALCLSAPAYAQSGQSQPNTGVGIGALGGMTWTTASLENTPPGVSTESGTGYMVGIWFGGNRDGRVGLMGEASYVTKKVKFKQGTDTIDSELRYVEIPVLLRVNIGSRSRTGASFYFLAGPNFDIQVKGITSMDGQTDPDSDSNYQGLDIGLMIGAGFEVARIGVEGRYNWGLKSVLATDAAKDSGFGSTKQNTLQVVFKVRFN